MSVTWEQMTPCQPQPDIRSKLLCQHCGDEVAPILDPWGYNNWQGVKHGYHHVAATDNSDGKYVTTCADGQNEAEPLQSEAA